MPTFINLGTGTGGNNLITFSSIPQTYKDLVIIGSGSVNFNAEDVTSRLIFNGSSGADYYGCDLRGSSTSVSMGSSAGNDGIYFPTNAITTANNLVTAIVIQVLDYANTSRRKMVCIRAGYDNQTYSANSSQVGLNWGFWNQTSAISSISLVGSSGVAWTTTSYFNLYGLASS